MDAPISPSGLDLLIKEWIWLSRDFRNQLSKRLHSRNSSPAVFTSLGLLSGSSPKHQNPAPPKSVAYRASPHKDWEHGKHTQPQPSKGKTDLRTVINSRRLREMVLTPKGSGQWGLPPRSRAVNTSFYGARLSSTSSGAGLPTLPPSCASGRSGLWRAHISGSTQKRSGLWDARPLRGGFQSGQFRCFLPVRRFRTSFWLHN